LCTKCVFKLRILHPSPLHVTHIARPRQPPEERDAAKTRTQSDMDAPGNQDVDPQARPSPAYHHAESEKLQGSDPFSPGYSIFAPDSNNIDAQSQASHPPSPHPTPSVDAQSHASSPPSSHLPTIDPNSLSSATQPLATAQPLARDPYRECAFLNDLDAQIALMKQHRRRSHGRFKKSLVLDLQAVVEARDRDLNAYSRGRRLQPEEISALEACNGFVFPLQDEVNLMLVKYASRVQVKLMSQFVILQAIVANRRTVVDGGAKED
ncbi:hypothetical protein QBC39DRAFT_118250, partial [Podospora conica]